MIKIRSILPALCLLLLGLALPLLARAQEQGGNRAALVIRYDGGRVATHCVSFAEESISGDALLRRASLSVIAQGSGSGTFVCKIDEVGCNYPEENCHCRCMGGDCVYWTYFHLLDGAWHYSSVGAGSYQVRSGAVEGWAWGPGKEGSGTAPPVIPFEQICSAPAPEPTLEPTAEPTAEPPTWTLPRPSSTPRPTARQPQDPTATPAPDQPSATSQPAPPSATTAQTATPGASATALALAEATPRPTREQTATAAEVAAAAATTPAAPPRTTTAAPAPGGALRYLGFAGIVLVLLGAGLFLARRRARS
jgi:hypothetical protein